MIEIDKPRLEAERLFNEGEWVDGIAKQMGVTEECVKMWLRSRNLSVQPIPKSKEYYLRFSQRWERAVGRIRGHE